MDVLKQSISDLESQEQIFQNDLNNATDDNQAQDIINELNIVRNKLSEKRHELQQLQEKEQQRAEVIEEKVHAAEIPFAVAGINLDGIPVQFIRFMEDVVKADRKRIYNEHAIELEQAETDRAVHVAELERKNSAHVSYITELEEIIEVGKAANSTLTRENGDLRDFTAQQSLELEDLGNKLKNASNQIAEKDTEIASLKAEIEELQRDKTWELRQEQPVTNLSNEDSASLQAKADELKKLFAGFEDWGSSIKVNKPDGTFELVKRKEFETEWTSVDVPSFRPEDNSTDPTSDQLLITETVTAVEPPQFQTEEQAVPGNVLHGAVEAEPVGQAEQVTREEFQALVKRVEALEGNSVQEAA